MAADALETLIHGQASTAELAACLRFDPVLAARTQSAHLSSPLTTPAQHDLLRTLLLALPLADAASWGNYAARWRQSMTVATIAHALARNAELPEPESAWMAGLTHNLSTYCDAAPPSPLQSAALLTGADGWLTDAVRYHAEPLPRGRGAHALVRVAQLAYLLGTRVDALDSVDVRAALASLNLGSASAARLLADSQAEARQLALRFGLDTTQAPPPGLGADRFARLVAGQAAQAALHSHFRRARDFSQRVSRMRDALSALFGIEQTCLYAPTDDGYLRASALWPARDEFSQLAVAEDESHSVLSVARSHGVAQRFLPDNPDTTLGDVQLARLLGATDFVCQPLVLENGDVGLLLCGDPGNAAGSPLWQSLMAEWTEAMSGVQPVTAHIAPAPYQADGVPRERVRRAVHEVSNPLTIMRNYVNLLSTRLGSDSAVQRDLTIIRDEIDRVGRIVRGLTAAEENDITPAAATEQSSVNNVISELVRMTLGTLLAPNKVNVQIDLNPDVPSMPLNKDQLKQVLFNLAKNAVEAMPTGGHLKFTTRLVELNGQRQIEIEIADTGPGLPPEVQAHLFEPVVSQKGGDHAGLGLSISHNLIVRMNGSLTCASSPQGTHFLIRLPTLQGDQIRSPSTTTRYGST
ncbi:MAG: ATP-binding protein [Thiobacillus sp.]